MNRLYLILVLLTSTLASDAQYYPNYHGKQKSNYASGSLRIQLTQNGKYVLRLNNKTSFFNGNSTRIDKLEPGIYTIILEKQSKNNGGQRLYKGAIFIEKNQILSASIDAFQRISLESNWLNQNYQGGFYDGDDFYCPWLNNPYNNGNSGNQYDPVFFMDDNEFKTLLQLVKKASFDTDREKIARQAITHNSLSAMQVRDLVESMDFETTKLKVAKTAYDRSEDKGRFYLVNDAFDYSSSITELNRYMGN